MFVDVIWHRRLQIGIDDGVCSKRVGFSDCTDVNSRITQACFTNTGSQHAEQKRQPSSTSTPVHQPNSNFLIFSFPLCQPPALNLTPRIQLRRRRHHRPHNLDPPPLHSHQNMLPLSSDSADLNRYNSKTSHKPTFNPSNPSPSKPSVSISLKDA